MHTQREENITKKKKNKTRKSVLAHTNVAIKNAAFVRHTMTEINQFNFSCVSN